MTNQTSDEWNKFDMERLAFSKRDTEGFLKDLDALANHIRRLQSVCPKDNAGWPKYRALQVISTLQKEHDRFKRYLSQFP